MSKEIKRFREYIEWTIVWKDRRKKKTTRYLELKELRLLNQLYDAEMMVCIEVRVLEHYGTRDEFEQIYFG